MTVQVDSKLLYTKGTVLVKMLRIEQNSFIWFLYTFVILLVGGVHMEVKWWEVFQR